MKTRLLLLYLIFCSALFAQINKSKVWTLQTPLSNDSMVNEDRIVYQGNWKELIEKRTLYSHVFQNEKGDIKARYSLKPIHYYNEENILIPIDFGLKKTGSDWNANQQPFPTHLYSDGSFSLNARTTDVIKIGAKTKINDIPVHTEFSVSENIVFFEQITPHIDKQIAFLENAIKFTYRLNVPFTFDGDSLMFEEKIDLPKGFQIEQQLNKTTSACEKLIILDDKGLIVSRFEPIICFDSAKKTEIGHYVIHEKADGFYVGLMIDGEWLNSDDRMYPIYIDPLVTGPLSTWNGGYMPSCFMPVYNKDSIQVTIPAGTTATGVYVSGSFYADPFTPATMSQGAMYYSSSCGSSQIFTVTGATANLPGTAYLHSFNLMNPLSCCVSESCSDVSFWVRMHIGRNALGSGCNTTYIRYDPFASLYPFEVIVYGKTPETYGNDWYVSQTPICSNTCTFNATAYARYGVAPYTFTHPWSNEQVTIGQNIGCGTGAVNHVFTLTNPNCPIFCDSNFTSLVVPPPVITDACGTQILSIPSGSKPIIPATQPLLYYDSVLCFGDSVYILNQSCLPGGISHFYGDSNGEGNILFNPSFVTDSTIHLQYNAFAEINGCISDTQQINIMVYPNPHAQININPNPVVVTNQFLVEDASISPFGSILYWNWDLADSSFNQSIAFSSMYSIPGEYPVCLNIQDEHGCADSVCIEIAVVPAEISNINVISSNGDGANDYLAFQYLNFYPDNELFIFNRWGQLIYSAKNYDNSWDGHEYNEGTYFYLLKVNEIEKTYQSFFQLVKD